MAKNHYELTLALAGVCQTARLAQQLARQGRCETHVYSNALQSLVQQHPVSPLALYGNDELNLAFGLENLLAVLANPSRQGASAELTRYALGLLMLADKLRRQPDRLQQFSIRVQQLDRQLQYFELTSLTIAAAVASVYSDLISPLGPPIQITGESNLLKNSQIQHKVRAVLLSGIRSALLWQHLGGGRLYLIFQRKQLVHQAKTILSRLPAK